MNLLNDDFRSFSVARKARPERRRRVFVVLVLGSLALHALLLISFPEIRLTEAPSDAQEATRVTVDLVQTLQQPEVLPEPPPEVVEEEVPEPQVDPLHLPVHNAEEVDLSGNTLEEDSAPEPGEDRPALTPVPEEVEAEVGFEAEQAPQGQPEANAGSAGEAQQADTASPSTEPEISASDAEGSLELAGRRSGDTATSDQPQQQETEAVSDRTDSPAPRGQPDGTLREVTAEELKGLQAMNEQELEQTRVAEPFSEKEARRIRMVNRFLERMGEQVRERIHMPASARSTHRGVIRFELDPDGYLLNARVAIPSGNYALDLSVLEAIRSVPRFDVPDSRVVAARYYRNLRFSYDGRYDIEKELFP